MPHPIELSDIEETIVREILPEQSYGMSVMEIGLKKNGDEKKKVTLV